MRKTRSYRIQVCYCGARYKTNAPNDPYCSEACRARVAAERVRTVIGRSVAVRQRSGVRFTR